MKYTWLSLWLTLGATTFAQTSRTFDHLTVGDGLTDNTVHALFQDRQGFLWVGTRYGLDRYDGSRFHRFLPGPNSGNATAVFALLEDPDGVLWVGLQGGGVQLLDPLTGRSEAFYLGTDGKEPIDWSTITVRSLFRDSRGWTWIGTYGGGAIVLDGDRKLLYHFRTYLDPPVGHRLSNDYVFDFAENAAGDVYLATAGDRVNVWRESSRELVPLAAPPGYSFESFAKTLVVGPGDELWVGVPGQGLFTLTSEGAFRHCGQAEGLNRGLIADLAFDGEERLWIATDGGGLYVMDPETENLSVHRYEPARSSSLNTDALYHLLFDQHGSLWIGSFNGGLNVLRRSSLPYVTNRAYAGERLAGVRSVLAVRQDDRGRVWLGTDGGGLYRFADTTTSIDLQPAPDALPNGGVVTCLQPDGAGGIWYGSYARGLVHFDPATATRRQYRHDPELPGSLAHDNVWDLALDASGGLWIGLLGGGVDYLPRGEETFIHFSGGADGLTDGQVIDVLLDDDGRHLWIATERKGLNRLDRLTGSIQQWREADGGLPSDRLRVLYQDRAGTLWVGTDQSGLLRYDRGADAFVPYGRDSGWPFDRVSGILEDSAGYLWISDRTQLFRWRPGHDRAEAVPPEADLGYNLYNPRATAALADGRLVFGGVNGFSLIDPGRFTLPLAAPPVLLAGLTINDRRIVAGSKLLPEPLNTPEAELNLSYLDRDITFQLANKALLAPSTLRYAFRLQGYREEWSYLPEGSSTLAFSSLPGGNYTLSVRTEALDGSPGPVSHPLRIAVRPPFYRHTWFGILVIGLVILFFSGLNTFLLRRQRAHYRREALRREREILRLKNERLQTEVREKLSELGASLLQVAHKNAFLSDLKDRIRELPDDPDTARRSVLRVIDQEVKQEDYWEQFQLVFDEQYRAFVDRLRDKHPELTTNESRLCCFLRMELTNQEIASILNVTLSAVEQAKYRLKKKFGLAKATGLNNYVQRFE